MPAQRVAGLRLADLAELEAWADRVCEQASGWAERAESSRGERRELTSQLDGLASRARHIASVTAVLRERGGNARER